MLLVLPCCGSNVRETTYVSYGTMFLINEATVRKQKTAPCHNLVFFFFFFSPTHLIVSIEK